MKTEQTGYYRLPNGLNLHFSINSWYNLEEHTGLKTSEWLMQFGTELARDDRNEFVLIDHLADIVLAAAKAYAQEEDEMDDFKLNRFKVRTILTQLDGEGIQSIANCIFRNIDAKDKLGK